MMRISVRSGGLVMTVHHTRYECFGITSKRCFMKYTVEGKKLVEVEYR